ncbi:MAG: ComEC/Rec2 family competence protein [Parcubacteria group bacterium]
MIVSFISGFIGGIALGSFIPISVGFFLAIIFVTLIFFIYKYFALEEHRSFVVICFVLMLGLSVGVGRMYVSDLYAESSLSRFEGQRIVGIGVIVGEPDVRESNVKLTIRLSSVLEGTTSVPVSEKILITTPIYPEFKYGDKVEVSVILLKPKNVEGDDGRVFDYEDFLRVRGIWYTGSFAKVKLVSSGHGSVLKNVLFKTKASFTNSINNALPQPESSLLSGLLLGSKQSLGKGLLEEFQRTGTSHIVVLSGYNIAIVAKSVMSFLKFLPNSFSFGLGVVSVILFTILSGGGASAVRASIMVLVALFAKHFNRDYKANRVLGFTVILMLAPNPLLLVFDPSFQLSVLATIGIIFVTPILEPYFVWVTEKFGLREIVASTVSTQLTVLPFLTYSSGIFSIVSLPINILILSTIPLTMFLGFITGMVSLVSLYISFIPAFFTYIFLWYQLTIVHLGSSVPFGAVTLPAFSPLVLVFVYLVVFLFLYRIKKNK